MRPPDVPHRPRAGDASAVAAAGRRGGRYGSGIRWVHASEMPDPAPYLRGDEVVLTAGIWYWHGMAPGAFAAGLGQAKAAALGFGTNPLVDEGPTELVEACRAWGLTLFHVPPDISFIEIAEEFVEAQHRLRERPLLDSLERSGRFLYCLQQGGGLEGLLRVLSGLLPRPAAVVQRGRGVIADTGAGSLVREVAEAVDEAIAAGGPTADLGGVTAFAVPIAASDSCLVVAGGGEPRRVVRRGGRAGRGPCGSAAQAWFRPATRAGSRCAAGMPATPPTTRSRHTRCSSACRTIACSMCSATPWCGRWRSTTPGAARARPHTGAVPWVRWSLLTDGGRTAPARQHAASAAGPDRDAYRRRTRPRCRPTSTTASLTAAPMATTSSTPTGPAASCSSRARSTRSSPAATGTIPSSCSALTARALPRPCWSR